MAKTLTPRGKTLHWHSQHEGITESPPGSNRDNRADGITHAQKTCADGGTWLVGLAWCGVWAFMGLRAAGVNGLGSWMASVSAIEQKARAKAGPFRGWLSAGSINWKLVFRGDLVVMFGEGVHVETIRSCAWVYRVRGLIVTNGGNTGADDGGSQSNGGGAFRRKRRISDIHGVALVNFPGK